MLAASAAEARSGPIQVRCRPRRPRRAPAGSPARRGQPKRPRSNGPSRGAAAAADLARGLDLSIALAPMTPAATRTGRTPILDSAVLGKPGPGGGRSVTAARSAAAAARPLAGSGRKLEVEP